LTLLAEHHAEHPISFPCSAWECRLPRSAWSAEALGRGSVPDGIPTQSVGTRLSRWLVSGCGKSSVVLSEECRNIAIAPIAKLRNQLLRRPAGTFGMVFSSHGFTEPAIQLAHFALPQSILLWTGDQVEYALDRQNNGELCEMKYRMCVDYGMLDFNVTTGAIA
jgi:hypothetical protein